MPKTCGSKPNLADKQAIPKHNFIGSPFLPPSPHITNIFTSLAHLSIYIQLITSSLLNFPTPQENQHQMAATMASSMSLLNPKCSTTHKPLSSSKPIIPSKLSTNSPSQNINNSLTLTATTSTAIASAIFATLSTTESAFAAQQIADLAEGSDNRGTLLLLVVAPAIGWVLFNILQPALNQINRMRSSKGVIVGLGLGGMMALAGSQDQASAAVGEIGSLAAAAAAEAGSDNRGTLLLLVVAPAIGWVLFNILQPALNQINRMRSD